MSAARAVLVAAAALLGLPAPDVAAEIFVDQVPAEAAPFSDPAFADIPFDRAQPAVLRLTAPERAAIAAGGNVARIEQQGSGNHASSIVSGAANATIQVQRGNGNESRIAIDRGARNYVGVRQEGDRHSSSIELVETSGQKVLHLQSGSGQAFAFRHSGQATPQPVVIIQRGRD
jgi:hypothetical protein